MSREKKMLWSKLHLPFGKRGKHANEDVNGSTSTSNVTREYKEAFRTKSYIEMCNQVQCETEIGTVTCLDRQSSTSSSSLSPPPSRDVHLSKHLLDLKQETLTRVVANPSLHQYFVDYFTISLEASEICENLLTNVHQVHINYHPIKRLTNLIKRQPSSTRWSENRYQVAYNRLSSFVMQKNPFATMTLEKFHELHDTHVFLLHELTSQCEKTRRKTKLIRWIKRAVAGFLVSGCSALVVALIVLAIHSVLGVVAAPGLILITSVLFLIKKTKAKRKSQKNRGHEDLGKMLDNVAKGVYIMINDFDTMSRLVQRLSDDMEHKKFIADICIRRKKHEMAKKVVKEFQMHESCFLEQLEELEKQIYLCFLDINRSRRLVVREMANS